MSVKGLRKGTLLKILPMEYIIPLYLTGVSSAEICRRFGTSHSTLVKNLKLLGISTRNLSQAQSLWQKGRKFSEQHKNKISNSKKGKKSPKPEGFGEHLRNRMKGKTGELHPCWRGGRTLLRNRILRFLEYSAWRKAVYERDNYTCQDCGVRGGDLNAHHKKPAADIIKENNLITTDDAKQCKELWDVNNGLTLCHVCHCKTERKLTWRPQYH